MLFNYVWQNGLHRPFRVNHGQSLTYEWSYNLCKQVGLQSILLLLKLVVKNCLLGVLPTNRLPFDTSDPSLTTSVYYQVQAHSLSSQVILLKLPCTCIFH